MKFDFLFGVELAFLNFVMEFLESVNEHRETESDRKRKIKKTDRKK